MISFVWTPGQRLPAGTGGSENYTIGQVRELTGRGVAAQVVTVGLGTADGRDEFVDIPFLALAVRGRRQPSSTAPSCSSPSSPS